MFRNERLVVWEYVANELEYVDAGTSPVVKVRLDSKSHKITVSGNGRGMSWGDDAGLEHFFLMHGENQDRKAGRPGRGFFGTGKSAAFGIGDVLRITTVRAGKRSKVELRRGDLEAADSGDPVPVRTLEREIDTGQANGTVVEVEGIHLRSLDQAGVVHYVERHLAHWPKDVTVLVNNHECEFVEPPVDQILTFSPPADLAPMLGDSVLTIKVSKSPLDKDLRGVSVFSNGVWYETTLLTSDGKEMADFIFGEIDVPSLTTDSSTPPPFDASRSMRLNPDNALVQAIYAFLGPHVEGVRKSLMEAQRAQRETEESKRLRREASQIEEIINKDFDAFRKRLHKVKAASEGAGPDAGETERTGDYKGEDDFLFGGTEPATITNEVGEQGSASHSGGGKGGIPRRLNPIVAPDPAGDSEGHYEGRKRDQPRQRGGFHIEFDNQGESSARAIYQAEKRTIYINLDHPQIAAAKQGRSAEDPTFRRLAYEVAFSEYSVALASELDNRGEYVDPSDPIVDIRETINRVARQAAALYA
jgi:hypothetical protein